MDAVAAWAHSKQIEFIAFLRELVECESPSDDSRSVERWTELFSERISPTVSITRIPGRDGFGPHLICEFVLPGEDKQGQIVVLGHSDTVYPVGTLASMPFEVEAGRISGPGVFDMKGGIAMFVFAMRALAELGLPVHRKVVLQLNSDEEMGSHTSRSLTEEQARQSEAVIVIEPAAGSDGKAKTSRKGVGDFLVRVLGKSAHAGLDFAAGASAVVELARQIEAIAAFTDFQRGLTVNPGVIAGGTRANVVAAEAWCDVDVRVGSQEDWTTVANRFAALRAFDSRCSLEVNGDLNRPPMERTAGGARLFSLAQTVASEIGFVLQETSVGGGSDGNFTAALGIPTLDGMGAVGDGAHTPQEYILQDRIPERIALLARLIQAL